MTMVAILFFLAMQTADPAGLPAVAPVATEIGTVAAAPPPAATAWTALAPLPWRAPPVLAPAMTEFVAAEVSSGRCAAPHPNVLSFDLAVRVAEGGRVSEVVPRAIGCPTVEQYAAGLVTGFARNNLRSPSSGWYRVAVSFTLA